MNQTQQPSPSRTDGTDGPAGGHPAGGRPTAGAVTGWVLAFLAELLDVSPDEIDPATPLDELGVDSATVLVMCAGLAAEFGIPVRPRDVLDHFTADAVGEHLSAPLPAGV
ncbi:acyl carrier protein [Streptomyces ficellus]|uniref:Acyl carrier protein n=1 Tax=Streptomyces ficellus TaxID=1977088 RepID=A0A6I6FEY5_9ACTN|nr:acyl carrier protein [Streptomyces ficellus]QGV82210.1 acyl carrier protein [Streptomyces ficellus]